MNNITAELLHKIFAYEDGELRWKQPTGPRVKAGDVAGQALSSHGYKTVQLFGKTHKAHQLIYVMFHDAKAGEIDHINGNRSDNRIENLRVVTRSQNCSNQRIQTRSTSGFKGVTFLKKNQVWRARIKTQQKEIYLGSFANKEDAAHAYNQAAIHHFGVFAKTNQVEVSQ